MLWKNDDVEIEKRKKKGVYYYRMILNIISAFHTLESLLATSGELYKTCS